MALLLADSRLEFIILFRTSDLIISFAYLAPATSASLSKSVTQKARVAGAVRGGRPKDRGEHHSPLGIGWSDELDNDVRSSEKSGSK